MYNRQVEQNQEEQATAGWQAMLHLIAHVRNGGSPAVVAPTIMCRRDEVQYGALTVDAQIFCSADVEYSSSMFAAGGLLFTAATLAASAAVNANNRRKAEAAARPQWRPWGRFPAIITNQRLLVMTEQWSSYDYGALLMIEPHPDNYSAALHFEGANPIMVRGPWVPWATVVICAALFRQPWPPGYQPPPSVAGPVHTPSDLGRPELPAPPRSAG
ncbi:hypothetical protein BJY16_007565 [Actinoplanes octamycinicus]|uniref:Uncharacterized protein n=1 Tax=Actinoplanes octamycinicus TaxID=135948 RepID=A0A7W7MBJ8_9ACTN|nr:hypothetical protein [Actinoplanes octamycinicus]MBB4744106.1 hypothetical protein [Actinoplanes octamycinicus]GIE56936.1 hypothetical protein Aoc01nite_23380 [Actinoplanes octamycinicus]